MKIKMFEAQVTFGKISVGNKIEIEEEVESFFCK